MQKHMSRTEREDAIVDLLDSINGCLSAREIAVSLGMSKSPNLISMLEELCDAGLIVCVWARGSNSRPTRFFAANGKFMPFGGL